MSGKGKMVGVQVKQKMVQQIEVAMMKLSHIPYIVSKRRKMAVWSDIRETLFLRCVHPRCSVVLSAMKSHLQYPASEKCMHPCSASEQLQFMKQYMAVSPGTLLVDLSALENRYDMMTLFDMIKIKHDVADDEVIQSCCCLSEVRRQEKYFQRCTENPLKNMTRKLFLPSIQRVNIKGSNNLEQVLNDVSAEVHEKAGPLIKSVLYNSFGGEASTALVPMYLLKETYPASIGFLEEVVRLYIIGRCEHSSLRSVSKCNIQEGYQFSRFMAMQYGFEKHWPYMTSNSLLISWEEFWKHNGRNKDSRLHVSVVILNCKAVDECDEDVFGVIPASKNKLQSTKTDNSKPVPYRHNIQRKSVNIVVPYKSVIDDNLEQNSQNPTYYADKTEHVYSTEKETLIKIGKVNSMTLGKTNKPKRCNSCMVLSPPQPKEDRVIEDILQAELTGENMTNETVSQENSSGEITKNVYGEIKNMIQLNKDMRVTRSKSQNSVIQKTYISLCPLESLAEVPAKDLNKPRPSIKSEGTFYQNSKNIIPNANNSADLDNISNKGISCEKNKILIDTANELDDPDEYDQCQSIDSQDSDTTEQNDFGTGKIDVSITLKKNIIDETTDEETQQTDINTDFGTNSQSTQTKQTERKTLKCSSTKFIDKIPELLRVNRYLPKNRNLLNTDTDSGKKQLTPKAISPIEKHETVEATIDSDTPREGTFAIQSLELNVPKKTSNLEPKDKEQFPYKARRMQHVEKKETGSVTNVFPVVNGVKLRRSPLKDKDRPQCKSAVTIPGPVNKIPNKHHSANHRNPGKLPDEIVSNLMQQATNSICSVIGNSDLHTLEGIVTTGKHIISPGREGILSDTDSTYFQSKRITMWKDRLEDDIDLANTGRQCKSADAYKKKQSPYIYRPSSSIYNPLYSEKTSSIGPSMNTGICVLLSRERSKSPQKVNQTKHVQQNIKGSPSPKKSHDKQSPNVSEAKAQNYGSSSSRTPDIYDEFARKRKPRTSKPASCEQNYTQNTNIRLKQSNQVYDESKKHLYQKASSNMVDIGVLTKSKKCDETKIAEHDINSLSADVRRRVSHNNCESMSGQDARHTAFTSNVFKIMDANSSKQKAAVNDTLSGVINEAKTTRFSTCTMCRHESKMHLNLDELEVENNTPISSFSSMSVLNTDSSKMSVNHLEGNDSVYDEGKGSIHFREESMNSSSTMSTSSNKRITLLDKMNLFVDGMGIPKASESLEDLENIKNIIKINPMDTSYIKKSINASDKESFNTCTYKEAEYIDDTNEDFLTTNGDLSVKTTCHMNNHTSNDSTMNGLNTDDSLNLFKKWETSVQQDCNPESKLNIQLPRTKSLMTIQRGPTIDHFVELDNIRKDIEVEAKNVSKEIYHDNKDEHAETHSINFDRFSSDDNKSTGSSDSEPDYTGLIIDTFALDRKCSATRLARTPRERSQNTATTKTGNIIQQTGNKHEKSTQCKSIDTTNRGKGNSKKTKNFRDVIKKKRATKRKSETEFEKKRFWKSAIPKSPQNNRTDNLEVKRKSLKKKKSVTKCPSEANTTRFSLNCPAVARTEKKRPKTSPVKLLGTKKYIFEKSDKSKYIPNIGNNEDASIETSSSKRAYGDESFTDRLDDFANKDTLNTEDKSLTNRTGRPKTVESKTENKRVLRPRAVKSARSRRRLGKCLDDKELHDKTIDEKMDNSSQIKRNNASKSLIGCPKSIARQKKLRKNVQDSILNKHVGHDKTSSIKEEYDAEKTNEYLLPQGPENVEIDERNILCETIPYENILETNFEPIYPNEVEPWRKTFITECCYEGLQSQETLENSQLCLNPVDIRTETAGNVKENCLKEATNLSQNAIPEMETKLFKNNLATENPFSVCRVNDDVVEDIVGQYYLYQDENGEMREVNLSELPQSVLQLVMSDTLLEMPCGLPMNARVEAKKEYAPVVDPCLKHDACHESSPNEIPIPSDQRSKNVSNVSQKFIQKGNSENDDMRLICNDQSSKNCICENPDQESNDCLHQNDIVYQLDNHTPGFHYVPETDVTDNGITIVHPNGTKVILTESHPAFALFSDIFPHQKERIDTNDNDKDIIAEPIESSENNLVSNKNEFIQPPLLITEISSQGQKQEHGIIFLGQTDQDNYTELNERSHQYANPVRSDPMHSIVEKQTKQTMEMTKNKQTVINNNTSEKESVVTKEHVRMCFDSLPGVPSDICSAKPKLSYERENIFDVLSAELDAFSQQRTRDAQMDLFPETIIEEYRSEEIKNKYVDSETELKSKCVDFENEFIKMIRNNFDSSQSDKKDLDASNRKNTIVPNRLMKDNKSSEKVNYVENGHCLADLYSERSEESCSNISNGPSVQLGVNDKKYRRTIDRHKFANELPEPCDVAFGEISNKTSLYSIDTTDEPSTLNKNNPVFRSAALGIRVTKSSIHSNDQNRDFSDSESSRTYKYGAGSNTCTDLTESEFQISDDDDIADGDYYPEDEDSECNLPVGYNETVNALFEKFKRRNDTYGMEEERHTTFSVNTETKVNTNKQVWKKIESGADLTSDTRSLSTISYQSEDTDVLDDTSIASGSVLSKETKKIVRKKKKYNKKTNKAEKAKQSKMNKTHKTKIQTMHCDIDEGNEKNEDTRASTNLVTTQKLYFDILKKSSGLTESRIETPERFDDLENILSDGFSLKRDRDMSRALAEADRMKEGTGSLEDLEKDDSSDAIAEDPGINCRYQVVEDEDGITLGGVVYYNEYTLPFVYINGYKYTPLKDAVTLFQPDCCAWKCRIPKSVMTKNKKLIKTFSTWEQVYKLELIKLKKGPPITTGDTLVKLDSLVNLLPSLLLDIIAEHQDSKLKHSQECDMKSYMTLQNKLM